MKPLEHIRKIVSNNSRQAERRRVLLIIDAAIERARERSIRSHYNSHAQQPDILDALHVIRDLVHTGHDPTNPPTPDGAVS